MADAAICVNNFLTITTPASSGGQVALQLHESEGVDPEEVAKQIIEDFSHLARQRGMDFVVRMANSPRLPIRRDHLALILSNLVHNAVKYGHDRTTIRITGGLRSEGFAVDVTSYGIPILEHEWERIFELGYRSAAAGATQYVAAGLGLFIARKTAVGVKARLSLRACALDESYKSAQTYRSVFRFLIPVPGRP